MIDKIVRNDFWTPKILVHVCPNVIINITGFVRSVDGLDGIFELSDDEANSIGRNLVGGVMVGENGNFASTEKGTIIKLPRPDIYNKTLTLIGQNGIGIQLPNNDSIIQELIVQNVVGVTASLSTESTATVTAIGTATVTATVTETITEVDKQVDEKQKQNNNSYYLYGSIAFASVVGFLGLRSFVKSLFKMHDVSYFQPEDKQPAPDKTRSNVRYREVPSTKAQVPSQQKTIISVESKARQSKEVPGTKKWSSIEEIKVGSYYDGHRILAVDRLNLLGGKIIHTLIWGGVEGGRTAHMAEKGSKVLITTGSLKSGELVVNPLEIDKPSTYDGRQIIGVESTSTEGVWLRVEGWMASLPFTKNTEMIVSINDPKIIEGKFKKD